MENGSIYFQLLYRHDEIVEKCDLMGFDDYLMMI
jgi:hypothetical protein